MLYVSLPKSGRLVG